MECFTGEKALEKAKDWIENWIKQNDLSVCNGIIIENQSQFTLEYITSGYNTGWPQTGVVKAFQQSKEDPDLYQLPPGYISFRVKTPGKNYIVPVGWLLGRNRCNKMGIQIRGQDGVLDGRGNVAGHGVDATGVVTDIVEFCCQVVGKFNNLSLATHHFTFKDGDAMKATETTLTSND